MNQPVRGRSNLVYGVIECLLVGARGAIHAAQFPDELQRRGADFVVSGWRLEIGERLDVSAHVSVGRAFTARLARRKAARYVNYQSLGQYSAKESSGKQ
jgi:hypothetical protein